jgi:hypothetical protein
MKFSILLIGICFLCGCASQDRLTYPSGKWVEINPKGFIPKDVQKYSKDSEKKGVFNEVI